MPDYSVFEDEDIIRTWLSAHDDDALFDNRVVNFFKSVSSSLICGLISCIYKLQPPDKPSDSPCSAFGSKRKSEGVQRAQGAKDRCPRFPGIIPRELHVGVLRHSRTPRSFAVASFKQPPLQIQGALLPTGRSHALTPYRVRVRPLLRPPESVFYRVPVPFL